MEQYVKYLKNKKVIIGALIIAGLIILNSLNGCGCGHQDEECSTEHATMQHICSGACSHGMIN